MKDLKKFLAFDLGASSGCAIVGLLDGEKLTLDEIHRFPNEYVKVQGSMYWDILRLFLEIKRGLALFAKKYGTGLDGIGIDTWGMDFSLFDKEEALIGNPYHYRDRRTEGVVEKISSVIDRYEIYKTTGCKLARINTISQLYSMVEDNSPQLRMADFLLMMPGTLNYFLTGKRCEEYTVITPTCLYDVRENGLALPFFEKLDIRTAIMPKVVPSGTIIGELLSEVGEEVGLGKVPVIAPACHDSASAAVAIPTTEGKNWAYLSAGTWFNLGVETPAPLINRQAFEYNVDNIGAPGGKFIARIATTGLWIIQKCKDSWEREGESLDYGQMNHLARTASPSPILIDFDADIFVNPADMSGAIVRYCKKVGKRPPESKAAMIRVILESLAVKCKETLRKIENLRENPIENVYIVGGGAQNTFLCQLIANATGKNVTAGPVEATAIGNILMQAIATGCIESITEARRIVKSSFKIQHYYPGESKV